MPPRALFLRPSTMRIVFRPIHHHPFLKYYSTGSPPDFTPFVGEEATAIVQISGETKPEIGEQGTPINEDAPSVMTDSQPGSTTGEAAGVAAATSLPASPLPPPGAKFDLPELPIPARSNMKYRYSPLLEQVTNFLMRHGKKATAQSNVNKILSILRTKPAPKPNPVSSTSLIPGTPALASLPADPIAYLQTAIDSVAPLMKLISVKGAGGSKDIIPSPLNVRQRRRTALEWISDAADKRADRNRLPERFADEIVAVVEGRSTAWDRRTQVHRQAILARANVSTQPRRRGKNTLKFPYN